MPRDAWGQLDAFLQDAISESTEECARGALQTLEAYKSTCRRISTLNEVRDKMRELVGNPQAPGDDV
jgi:hypothetical protein